MKPREWVKTRNLNRARRQRKVRGWWNAIHKEEYRAQVEGQSGGEWQTDEGNQGKQGKSLDEGKWSTEVESDFYGKPERERWTAKKHLAEDHGPWRAKNKKKIRVTDFPIDSQEIIQESHLGSWRNERMWRFGDLSRAQEELWKKDKMSGLHWMQRNMQN